jgi:hypothetical protein
MKTVPNYPGGILCVMLFAVIGGLRVYWLGNGHPLLWGLACGAITLAGVALLWMTCGWEDR